MLKYGQIIEPKPTICKVEGCDSLEDINGYCSKHYQQMYKHGKVYNRTIYDPNEVMIHKDYAEIILYDKNCNEIGGAIIDIEDIEKVTKFKWHIIFGRHEARVSSHISRKENIFLHHVIMGKPEKNKVIDHINGNPLDNRKSNLRFCTHNTSGYPGVSWHEQNQKWKVTIKYNGQEIYLGYYISLKKAIKVRQQAEIKYFGEYRRIYEGVDYYVEESI